MNPVVDEELHYQEPGAGAGPLLWGPGFALVGYLVELWVTPQQHAMAWLVVGVVLLLCSAVWVGARRRFMSVRVSSSLLSQGSETLALERVVEICDEDAPLGTRVLGGGFTAPRKYGEVALRLDDGSRVVAWARDPEQLRTALRQASET